MDQPVLRAVRDGAVCMVNPLRCKMLHKKASLAVLSDERNAALFDADERAAIAAHIPWTRVVEERRTDFDGSRGRPGRRSSREHRERLVLKPNDDYGGAGIVLGWEVDDAAWEAAIRDGARRAVHRAGADRACRPSRIRAWSTGGCEIRRSHGRHRAVRRATASHVDGCLTRLSTAALLNVTAGGGSTVPTFVVEPRSSSRLMKAAVAHPRHRGRVSDHRSGDAGAQVLHHRDPRAAITCVLGEVKPELHQSMVEVGTKVCRTPAEVRAELVRLRRHVMELAGKNGLVIAAAGTHPFSSWMTQEITPLERYMGVQAGPRRTWRSSC